MSRLRKRFEEDENENHMDESWLIPYADILTLLLALFIVLFASSSINKSKYDAIMEAFKSELTGTKIVSTESGLSTIPTKDQKDQGKSMIPPTTKTNDPELDVLRQKLEKYITDNHMEASITIESRKRGLELSLKDYILFDSGKADLKPSSFKTLSDIIGLIGTVQNPISIEGHTDNVPIGNAAFTSNWELSSARAVSVLHYFESKNISESRLQFTGYGEYQPLVDNDTPDHRQTNRRVNIVILRYN